MNLFGGVCFFGNSFVGVELYVERVIVVGCCKNFFWIFGIFYVYFCIVKVLVIKIVRYLYIIYKSKYSEIFCYYYLFIELGEKL